MCGKHQIYHDLFVCFSIFLVILRWVLLEVKPGETLNQVCWCNGFQWIFTALQGSILARQGDSGQVQVDRQDLTGNL